MAELSPSERNELAAEVMRAHSDLRREYGLSKADIRGVIDAIDTWADTNQASFNQAIPNPARSVLTVAEKLDIFRRVVRARFEVS